MADPTKISGKLLNTSVSDFSTMRVAAEYTAVIEEADAPARHSAQATADGRFEFTLPVPGEWKGPLQLSVTGASGAILGLLKDVADDDDLDSLDIAVAADVAPVRVFDSDDPTLGTVARFTGRVIDSKGNGQRTALLIAIWGRRPGDTDPHPIAISETTVGGYFAGNWPSGVLSEAFARVATLEPVPIPLDGDRLPRRLLLVADDLPAPGPDTTPADPPRAPTAEELAAHPEAFTDKDCCCATFTTPNRTVEEVMFQAVVRTTQPEVMGVRARPPKPIPAHLVDRVVALTRLQPVVLNAFAEPDDRPDSVRSVRSGVREREEEAHIATAVRRGAALMRASELDDVSTTAATARLSGLASIAERSARVLELRDTRTEPLRLEASVLADIAREPGGITPARLLAAERTSLVRHFRHQLDTIDPRPVGRFDLSPTRQANWEAPPLPYQATTVAHGHLVTMKQVWRADGYSLGDLLYSLPLAPGQQKLISILDWERRDEVRRTEHRIATESLSASLSHDRDISDIVRSALHERMDASSRASTSAVGTAVGGFIGPIVFGAAGGVSKASSSAQQASSRDIAASALNQARDRTLQAASAVRGQRATVVQAARQGEAVRAQTEAIANNNHCHAMTIEYFEVLRHFQVSQEMAHVQECLFIPFAISPFTSQKALRWRHILQDMAIYHGGTIVQLRPHFDACERVASHWAQADYPPDRYADETIRDLSGELWIDLSIPRPADTDTNDFAVGEWQPYRDLLGVSTDAQLKDIWERYMGIAMAEQRGAIWDTRLAPAIARRLIDNITVELHQDGVGAVGTISMDATLVSRFAQNTRMLVSFRASGAIASVTRAQVNRVRTAFGSLVVPPQVRAVVHSGTFRYRTDHMSHSLFEDYRIQNDLSATDPVEIATPLDRNEKRNPRLVDQKMQRLLLDVLNERLEYFHRLIWLAMDPNRRFMFLDGIVAPDAGGRSVASVVENRVIGIVGNSLVMPVVPGLKLDPTYEFAAETQADLRHHYVTDPPPPMRISVPTRGVFAEAVMGKCNSCEKIDDTLFWRWEDAPIPDSPTAIAALSLDSRRQAAPSVVPSAFPDALVRYQVAPQAPDPTGLTAALALLGTKDLFRNLTGLALNQENSAAALKGVMTTAQQFASQGAALAQQRFLSGQVDRNLALIKKARDAKQITPKQAEAMTEGLFKGALGIKKPEQAPVTSDAAVQKVIETANKSGNGDVRITRPGGTVEVKSTGRPKQASIDVAVDPPVGPVTQPSDMTCWAAAGTMMKSWQARMSMTIATALDKVSGPWRAKFDANSALSSSEVADFAKALGLTEEGPLSYSVNGLADLLDAKGPLWTIGDNDFDNDNIVHARIVTAMKGDGSIDGTIVTLADPTTGTFITESFKKVAQRLEGNEPVKAGRGIFHW